MKDFEFQNTTKIVFGKGKIARLAELIEKDERVLMLYGGGSIRKNGVYDQVTAALSGHSVEEFGGIEPNPQYTTCLKAVEAVKKHRTSLILAVGGGSVIDASKFIAAAAVYSRPRQQSPTTVAHDRDGQSLCCYPAPDVRSDPRLETT